MATSTSRLDLDWVIAYARHDAFLPLEHAAEDFAADIGGARLLSDMTPRGVDRIEIPRPLTPAARSLIFE